MLFAGAAIIGPLPEFLIVVTAIAIACLATYRTFATRGRSGLRCPGCGYPTVGLPEPRCPECGRDLSALENVTNNALPIIVAGILLVIWSSVVVIVGYRVAAAGALPRYVDRQSLFTVYEATPSATSDFRVIVSATRTGWYLHHDDAENDPYERVCIAVEGATAPPLEVRAADMHCRSSAAGATQDTGWVPLDMQSLAAWLANVRGAAATPPGENLLLTVCECARQIIDPNGTPLPWPDTRAASDNRMAYAIGSGSGGMSYPRGLFTAWFAVCSVIGLVGVLLILWLTGRRIRHAAQSHIT